MGRRFGFIGNVPFINNKKNEKAKNEQNGRDLYPEKAFRKSYQNQKEDPQKVTVPLPKKEDTHKDAEIEMFMEWFSNQRFPEEN